MWTLIVTNPQNGEHSRTYLRKGLVVTVGRAPDCTIMLPPMAVARHHGRIEMRDGLPVYFDDESSTGTRVDGAFIRGPTPIREGTVLEIGGYRMSAERTVPEKEAPAVSLTPAAATPIPAEPDPEDLSPEALLARRIRNIRMEREQREKAERAKLSQFEQGWQEILRTVRRLQGQFGADPRVMAFSINREEDEVLFKVRDTSQRGYWSVIIARRHPQGKFADLDAAWVLEAGAEDKFYQDAKAALEDFVERIAPRLA